MLEFNATILAQIVDFLIFGIMIVLIIAGIKRLLSKNKLNKDIEVLAKEVAEIRKTLDEMKKKPS